MFPESELLLQSIGVDLHGLDAAYLQVIDSIGAIRNCRHNYTTNDLEKVKLRIFWKTIREIGDFLVNDDGPTQTNAAISHILNAFAEQRSETDERMWLPMHFAMSIPGIDLEEVEILFDNNPDSISQGFDQESSYTPCHLAVMTKDPDMDLIEMLKELDPSFGVRQTRYESTALHLAAEFSNSIPVIQELIQEFPAALTMRDEDQKVPIACAFQNDAANAPDIFRILLQAAPQTATEPDNKGRFLLHQFLYYNSRQNLGSEEMVSIMLDAFPDVVNIADNAGWLPIHLAALTCRTEAFKMIIEANPAHLSSYNPNGGTVAHMAVNYSIVRQPLNSLDDIHSMKPDLFLSPDSDGNTPLAIAVKRSSILPGSIEAIASLEPAAAIIVNNNGDNLLHIMLKSRIWWIDDDKMAHHDILKLLLRLIPGGALATNNQGQTPYDLLNAAAPIIVRRLLLLAGAPSLHPETRQQMNYQARKGALFAFFAPRGGEHHSGGTDICHLIRHGAGAVELMREIVSFL